MVVFDMGFTDDTWFQTLTENRIFFVTRLKSNARIQGLRKRPGRKAKGITADQTILLGTMSQPLRKVCYQDPETGKELSFVTNADHLDAQTIAELYKERWQIELFFGSSGKRVPEQEEGVEK
jgi:IS4 transposase